MHHSSAYDYYLELKRKLNYYYMHQLPPPISLLDEYQRQTKIYEDLADHSALSHLNSHGDLNYHNLALDHHDEPFIPVGAHTDSFINHHLYEDSHFDEYHQLQHGF
jgi:hypothetical protein